MSDSDLVEGEVKTKRKNQVILISVVVVLFVALVVTAIVLAVVLPFPAKPPKPKYAPQFVGFEKMNSKNSVWCEQVSYQYAYLYKGQQGLWSDESQAVQSMVDTNPMFTIEPVFGMVPVFQRKINGHWQPAQLVPIDINNSKATVVDQLDPCGVPDAPNTRPEITPYAKYVDAHVLTWNRQGSWPVPMRFSFRYVGREASPWSPWSTQIWASSAYAEPVFQIEPSSPFTAQYTASWIVIEKCNSVFYMVVRKSSGVFVLEHTFRLGLTTIDAITAEIARYCCYEAPPIARAKVRFEFDGSRSLLVVDDEGYDQSVRPPTSFELVTEGSTVTRSLGFTHNIKCGVPGEVYVGDCVPNFSLQPRDVLDPNGVVIVT